MWFLVNSFLFHWLCAWYVSVFPSWLSSAFFSFCVCWVGGVVWLAVINIACYFLKWKLQLQKVLEPKRGCWPRLTVGFLLLPWIKSILFLCSSFSWGASIRILMFTFSKIYEKKNQRTRGPEKGRDFLTIVVFNIFWPMGKYIILDLSVKDSVFRVKNES